MRERHQKPNEKTKMQQTTTPTIRRPLDFRTFVFRADLQRYCRQLRIAADALEMIAGNLAYSPTATARYIKGTIEPGLAITAEEIKTDAQLIADAEAEDAAQRLAAELAARIA